MSFNTVADENTLKMEEVKSLLEILKPILSTETLKILQLLGFDFKAAVGEPLTELVRSAILSKVNSNDVNITKIITPEMVDLLKKQKCI